ncbi:translocating chain-associated membrane protein 1-like 1 isoform X2 [Lineus longissimus]|uniref:translocating chain-associated membrane protein 1-like 1 isoform X2 n=1 Tax=Lineus longissimus TaxID=88925 RepID=UPI002B4CE6F8
MGLRRPKSTKNPPFLSHEFIIQNHADAVSCVMMVFVIGLMFQATAPLASLFVAMQHNVTVNDTDSQEITHYTYGIKDTLTVFFYFMMCIVVHAVLQEYVLDKLNRKMHLSKIKHSKFNESGQLMVFYLVSAIWGINIILTENLASKISNLWDDYPAAHSHLPFIIKFFFIIQMAYWLHGFPELYFMKIKKEEIPMRCQYITLYFVFILAAYCLNFHRVAICLLVLHYTVEFLLHMSRLLYFAEKTDLANTGFMIFNALFVLIRLATITIAILTFWYGLKQSEQAKINFQTGNFNTRVVRIGCLAALCLMQAWMMWQFITFHLRRIKEHQALNASANKKIVTPKKSKDKKKEN